MYTFLEDFSSFHPNNFRNTISWKCSLKDNCIRSSLIECQSFFDRKINYQPKIPRLDVSSTHCASIVLDVVY